MPNLQAFHGEESARADSLKIVVSPVRVRVSPSRNPCKQAIFVQRSEAREKGRKGQMALLQVSS
jgi:hypothetical protein